MRKIFLVCNALGHEYIMTYSSHYVTNFKCCVCNDIEYIYNPTLKGWTVLLYDIDNRMHLYNINEDGVPHSLRVTIDSKIRSGA